jgi:hypothetical protein
MAYLSETDFSETSLWMERGAQAREVLVLISQRTDGFANGQRRDRLGTVRRKSYLRRLYAAAH